MNNDSNDNFENLSDSKKLKLNKKKEKYRIHENFYIAKTARKTIRYVEKNVSNFPNEYSILKNRLINSCYNILEYIYKANIFQEIEYKKNAVVEIQMLNFYLEESLKKELISFKKFESYTNHLLQLDKMIRSWFNYETSK